MTQYEPGFRERPAAAAAYAGRYAGGEAGFGYPGGRPAGAYGSGYAGIGQTAEPAGRFGAGYVPGGGFAGGYRDGGFAGGSHAGAHTSGSFAGDPPAGAPGRYSGGYGNDWNRQGQAGPGFEREWTTPTYGRESAGDRIAHTEWAAEHERRLHGGPHRSGPERPDSRRWIPGPPQGRVLGERRYGPY